MGFPRISDGVYKRSYYSKSFVEPLLVILGIPHVPFNIHGSDIIVHLQILAVITHKVMTVRLSTYESYFAVTAL